MEPIKKVHCGLCGEMVENWEEHEQSPQHKKNVADPKLKATRIGSLQQRIRDASKKV
jgi:hypothetical protein